MKKVLPWVVVLALLAVWVFVRPHTDMGQQELTKEEFLESVGEIQPLLYVAEDTDGDRVWLFGSIHIGMEELFPLPDYVMDAYNAADALAVEVDINDSSYVTASYGQMMELVSYHDGTTIRDHIDPELYERVCTILEENRIETVPLEGFKPYMWYSVLDEYILGQTFFDRAYGIDQHLLDLAYEQGKPIEQIESAEFQFALMGGMQDAIQEMLLESAVEQYESDSATLAYSMMMMAWTQGNEEQFEAFLSIDDLSQSGESVSDEERALYEEYNNAMITERNVGMTDYAEQALIDGKDVFICVGAAHVVGEGAMVDLLRERGYTVECVEP